MDPSFVWYTSYGSNLSRERFHCYVEGGMPEGSMKAEVGCRDCTLPLKEATYQIHHPLYFAQSSKRWQNQGVAFIGVEPSEQALTYSRQYLITAEQFVDVVRQENNGDELAIDLQDVIRKGVVTIKNSWYGTILYLGEKEGFPVFTFTAGKEVQPQVNTPSKEYIGMIISGLKKYVKLSNREIAQYLMSKPGVSQGYREDDIWEMSARIQS